MMIFRTKKDTGTFSSPVYRAIAETRGRSRFRTSNRYSSIAREAYKQNGVVFACLEQTILSSCQLKLEVQTKDADGNYATVKNHKINELFTNPNYLYSMNEFKMRAIIFYVLAGQAPIQFMNTILGSLYTYQPNEIQYNATGDDFAPYRDIFYTGGRYTPIPPEEFTLWKRYDPIDYLDGLGQGMSMIEPILKEIDQRNAMKEWNISLLSQGARMSGVFSTPDILPDENYYRAKKELKQNYQGKRNVGGILLLDGGLTFQETSVNPKDMDWIEGEKEVVKQICSGMRVDPILVGYNEYSTYNNKQEAHKELYTRNAIPTMQGLADSLERLFKRNKAMKPTEKLMVVYDHIPILQDDMDKKAERLNKSPYSINEKRIEMGKEEVKGGNLIIDDKVIINTDTGETFMPINMVSSSETKPIPKDKRENKNFQY